MNTGMVERLMFKLKIKHKKDSYFWSVNKTNYNGFIYLKKNKHSVKIHGV